MCTVLEAKERVRIWPEISGGGGRRIKKRRVGARENRRNGEGREGVREGQQGPDQNVLCGRRVIKF